MEIFYRDSFHGGNLLWLVKSSDYLFFYITIKVTPRIINAGELHQGLSTQNFMVTRSMLMALLFFQNILNHGRQF